MWVATLHQLTVAAIFGVIFLNSHVTNGEEKINSTEAGLNLADIINQETTSDEKQPKPKPFGYGVSSQWIGGSDVNYDGSKLSLLIFVDYLNYRRLTKQVSEDEMSYHERFTMQNQCVEGCPDHAECKLGLCTCVNGYIQIYGGCYHDKFLFAVGEAEKHRKPPDHRPENCFESRGKNDNGPKRVRYAKRDSPECQYHWEKPFKPFDQVCNPSKSNCTSKDINFVCDPEINKCRCKDGTKWNTQTYECQISMPMNCIAESAKTKPEEKFIKAITDGRARFKVDTSQNYPAATMNSAMCFLLEEKEEEYSKDRVDESYFLIFGLSAGAFFATCCGAICAACCCCKCCQSCREKIEALDPRNMARNMGPGTQMAALAAVAGGEYMDRREDKEDAMMAAQLQGNVPPPPPGYAPVPNPAAPYPAPGYPAPAPGYPAPAPGYPPAGQQPPYPPMGGQQPMYPPQQPPMNPGYPTQA